MRFRDYSLGRKEDNINYLFVCVKVILLGLCRFPVGAIVLDLKRG